MVKFNQKQMKKTADLIAEKTLNATYTAVFSTPSGQQVLKHLKSELGLVAPVGVTSTEMVHYEGGRFVLHGIINRIEKGGKNG